MTVTHPLRYYMYLKIDAYPTKDAGRLFFVLYQSDNGTKHNYKVE